MALPNELFVQIIETTSLDWQICQKQKEDGKVVKQWLQEGWNLEQHEDVWWKGSALVVTRPGELKKGLLETYHDGKTAGHLGSKQTYQQVSKDYWWPGL